MKKRLIIANLTVSILIVSILIFYSVSNTNMTGKAVFSPAIPADCSDNSIKTVWDSIFNESSAGIIIASNTPVSGKCRGYIALKNFSNDLYLLSGRDSNYTEIIGVHGNFSSQIISNLINNISQNSLNWDDETSLMLTVLIILDAENRQSQIQNVPEANAKFSFIFKPDNSTWYLEGISNAYLFNYSNVSAAVSINKNAEFFGYSRSNLICTPNWTAHNTTCSSNDRKTQYFTDSNSCNQVIENITTRCDYDSNGIMGNITSLTSRTGLNLYINSSELNISRNYSQKEYLVQFKSSNNTIVEFNWNFSSSINLDDIFIERQSASDTRGYVLIRGIPANKKAFIDRISNDSMVCVRNSEITSITTLTTNCTHSSELAIPCPGTFSGVSCAKEGNYLRIEGLTNSAAREFSQVTINCTQNWSCTSWGNCINEVQTRTCIDTNHCNNLAGRPSLNQSCIIPIQCTPNWNCSDWLPEVCPKSKNQTRTCNDKNLCNSTPSNKKLETKDCEYESKSSLLLIAIIAIIAILILILIIILVFSIKKSTEEQQAKPVTQYGYIGPQYYQKQ